MNDPLGLFDEEGLDPLGLFTEEEPGFLKKAAGVGETALSMASGGLAMPVAGLAGLATMDADTVGKVQEALTYSPRSTKGKEYTEATGKFLEEKVRQPMIKSGSDLSGLIPGLGPQLGENERELVGTIGADAFLNLLPGAAALKLGERATRPRIHEPNKIDANLEALRKAEEAKIPEEVRVTPDELDLFSPDQKQLGRSPYDANFERYTVDENGIPIKQRLSEDVQRMETPEQGQLFPIDEQAPVDRFQLARQAEEQKRMFEQQQEQARMMEGEIRKQEQDQAYAQYQEQKRLAAAEEQAAKRDQVLKDLEEELRVERESKGQQRKAQQRMVPRGQRGAIDIEGVKEAIDFFKQGLFEAQDVLKAFKGTFDDVEMQLAEKAMKSETSKDHIVLMSPDEFHSVAAMRPQSLLTKGLKHESIREGLKSKKGLSDIPYLLYDKNGKVISHEGRHRMDVFKEQGIDLVPVRIRGYDSRNLPEKLLPEDNLIRQGGGGITTPKPIRGPQSQRGVIDLGLPNPEKTKAIEGIIKSKLYAPEVKPEAVIESALAEGKDGSGSVNFSAGGTLEGAKRNSALITGGVRIVQRFKNIAEDMIRTNVFPVERSFRKLKAIEVQDLAKVFKQEMFARQEFTAQELASIGLNENQLVAYTTMRDMFKRALADMNQSRVSRGLEPVTPQEAYLSSRWRGTFRRGIYDAKGRLKWYLAAETKKGLDSQTQALLKEFPDLVQGEHVDHVTNRGRYKTDSGELYTTMLDVLGRDDPSVQKIKDWHEAQVSLDAEGAYAQTKHFEKKANIRGFVGDRPGFNPKTEALAMFQEQINYAKNAHKWASLTKAGSELKTIFINEDLAKQQPKNIEYLKEYYRDQIGLGTMDLVNRMEDAISNTGVSVNAAKDFVNTVKSLWITQKLVASAGFVLSNVLQATNMMPHLIDLQRTYKGNPLTVPASLMAGISEGALMATGHLTGVPGKLLETAKYRPGDSVFSAKAMKYAEDNSVIARSVYDESPIESSFSTLGRAIHVAGKTVSVPEAYLRSITFMTYAHMLKMSGKFKNDLELFRVAEEKTNISMGDYRTGERAMIFSKLGTAGDAMNILQTYPINFYNQYSWATREAGRGNPLPVVTMLATHYAIAGMMGIPGFQDVDKLWNWTKDQLAEMNPDIWNKVKDVDLKGLALQTLGERGLYGSASVDSGIALTSRAAAPAGSEMLANPAQPYIDMGKQAASLGASALDPLDPQKASQAALNIAPVGLQGALETGPLRDQTSVQRPEGRVYGKATDLASREGVYMRSPEEEKLRAFGLRSQKEVFERDQAYKARQKELQAQTVARKLPDRVYNEVRKGDLDKAREYMKLYVELTGNPMTEDMFQKRVLDEYMTSAEKAQYKAKNLQGLAAVKNLRDLLKEQNAGQ